MTPVEAMREAAAQEIERYARWRRLGVAPSDLGNAIRALLLPEPTPEPTEALRLAREALEKIAKPLGVTYKADLTERADAWRRHCANMRETAVTAISALEWALSPSASPPSDEEIVEAMMVAANDVLNDDDTDHAGAMQAALAIAKQMLPTHPAIETTAAARDVLAERSRQQSVEGWTTEHDDKHDAGELAKAASVYAKVAADLAWAEPEGVLAEAWDFSIPWPWDETTFKPSEDARKNLVRAGALILAEIERLDRVAPLPAQQEAKPNE